jgi:hypothetical protein
VQKHRPQKGQEHELFTRSGRAGDGQLNILYF